MKTKTKTKSKVKEKIIVSVVAHDSWSGPELLYTKEFSTRKAAENYCIKINSKNTAPSAPEYYETAGIGKW